MKLSLTEKLVEKWNHHRFRSSPYKTDEFKAFARDFMHALNNELPEGYEMISFITGHFYVSGFIKNEEYDTFVYFSIPDVRFWQDGWVTDVLFRTAKNDNDFTGGVNKFCHITHLVSNIKNLTVRK